MRPSRETVRPEKVQAAKEEMFCLPDDLVGTHMVAHELAEILSEKPRPRRGLLLTRPSFCYNLFLAL